MHRVCVVGSGNFGSTMAKVIAENIVAKDLKDFEKEVRMFVYDELIDGESIVDIINKKHENVKYLAGIKLPENIVAYRDLGEACTDCDYLVFVTPHQFITSLLPQMVGKFRKDATGISLIKGVYVNDNKIELMTELISDYLHIPCGGLMGANIAMNVAKQEFSETTIGFSEPELGEKWYPLFHNRYLRVKVIRDVYLQQLCGTLKNVIALGGGFIDGMGYGQNTKAAILRIGLEEMYEFARWYYPAKNCQSLTLIETCGIGDLIATSYGGRNHRCALEFAKTGKDFEVIEAELLKGQKLQGTLSAKEIYQLLKARHATKKFPLFTTIYLICNKQVPLETIFDYDGSHLDIEEE
ncbi:NAD-dependent glycerol-3-phosphate dehydrogenase family protein [Tritrichomonas foetus]|uniref:Glycerol-3-phosphate dehydrogenase [NAD(+)] n=1 Tax=Tritrichomonas foetus TaxID=1144522 RepID=A0A1J4KDR5_9EUKA|nr:NAD-dependent glycerol-3-phosphate dehydrogenase family protein [Tritrichomonas foetus]|eukprot:OHT09130.1 NAD-dependent glycerol-3-phosphate dehydrogenase family protein [Tritrichomonas foetus]